MKKIIIAMSLLLAAAAYSNATTISEADKERAASLVKQMTLEEKISLIGGAVDGFHTAAVERLGIPSVRMCDGPQGVRNNTNSTYYPCGMSAASSWSRAAVREMGEGIGRDAKARGVGIMLGPGVNIYRSAFSGRNFEYYGEDPFLAGETAANYIQGLQSKGVISTIKHFALNNQEYDRHNTSSNADERTINEIYFPAFRTAVEKGHVGAVMTSYNPINGTHAAENPWLIKENLRKWGFDGIVMSDWTSTYTVLGCVNGGLDLEMPKPYVMNYETIKPLLDNGVLTVSEIDEKVQHILQTFIAFGFLDHEIKDASIPEDNDESCNSAYKIALEGPVLLKNNGALPLKSGKKNKVVLVGPCSDITPMGGGSGTVDPFDHRRTTLKMGLESYAKSYPTRYFPQDQLDSPEALKALKEAKAVVVAVGFDKKFESEGRDRTFALPEGQPQLIEKVAALNGNVIVVLYSGGEADLSGWSDKVSAILMAWYPGQAGGQAVADLLSGKASPSGKLAFTMWGSVDNNPASKYYHPGKSAVNEKRFTAYSFTEYKEGIFLGYRGVEHFGLKPLYPFGYGLSYTSFEYSGLKVAPAAGGYDISFTISNTGKVDAEEVAEVYVAPVNPTVLRPAKELKGYEKVRVAKGKDVSVTVHLPYSSFSHYDVASHDWVVDPGEYHIQVGASSADIRLQTKVTR